MISQRTTGRRTSPAPASRRGTLLVAVVIALVMLQILVVTLTVAGARDQDLSSRRVEAARSYYAAESAANLAIREFIRNVDEDGDGTVGSVFSTNPAAAPSIAGLGGLPSATISGSGATRTLTAVGTAGAAERTITATLRRNTSTTGTFRGLLLEAWTLTANPSAVASVPWTTTPQFRGIVPDVNLPNLGSVARWPGGPTSRYGIRFSGTIEIPETGLWTFSTNSDDGSVLFINGLLVVNNDGLHSAQTRTGTAILPAGPATFEVRFFENTGNSNVTAFWRGPSASATTIIPSSAFSFTPPETIPPLAAASTITTNGANGGQWQVEIDGYDSRVGAYGGGNVLQTGVAMAINAATANAWTMSGQSHAWVDALLPPGGVFGTIVRVNNPADLDGTPRNMTTRVAIVTPALPSGVPATSGAVTISASQTINTNRRFASLTISGASTVVTITGDVTIVSDGAINLTGGARVELSPNSTLTVYSAGSLSMAGTTAINDNTKNPRLVRIFMTNSNTDVSLNDRAVLHASVQNPFGRLLFPGTVMGVPHFYGTFHGRDISIVNYGRIHADVGSLPAPSSGGGPLPPGLTSGTVIADWTPAP